MSAYSLIWKNQLVPGELLQRTPIAIKTLVNDLQADTGGSLSKTRNDAGTSSKTEQTYP